MRTHAYVYACYRCAEFIHVRYTCADELACARGASIIMCKCTCIYTYMCIQQYVHAYMYACMCVCMYVCIYTYIYTHTYTYTY